MISLSERVHHSGFKFVSVGILWEPCEWDALQRSSQGISKMFRTILINPHVQKKVFYGKAQVFE